MTEGLTRRLQLLLFLGSVCWIASFAIYPRLFDFAGISHFGVWFLDSFAILASSDAVARGLDPYVPNALDYFNRPHVYTHWWLRLHEWGITRADNLWVGLGWGLSFLVAAVAGLKPLSRVEASAYGLMLCSAPVLLAVNRANNDLVIFVLLAPVVPCLLSARPWVRMLPVALIAVATGLKFYPVIAGIVLLGGAAAPLRDRRARLALAALAFAGVGIDLAADLARLPELAPKTRGLMTFGAENMASALGLHGGPALFFGLAVVGMSVVGFWRARWLAKWVIPPSAQGSWLSFVLGSSLLTGCFFAGSNLTYRWIFALWLAPLLWHLPRDRNAPLEVRQFALITGMLLLYALWADELVNICIRHFFSHLPPEALARRANRFFGLEQPVTWALFICLLGFLTHFVREGVRRLFRADPGDLQSAP